MLVAYYHMSVHTCTYTYRYKRGEKDGGMGAPGKYSLELSRALSAVGPARTQDASIMS